MVSCQSDDVSNRCRVNSVSPQEEAVSRRRRLEATSLQAGAMSKWRRLIEKKDIQQFVKTIPCQDDVVPY